MVLRTPKFIFYLDENFPEPAGKFFKELGHVIIDGKKIIGTGKSDTVQLKTAVKHNAILVSLDRDFLVNQDLMSRIRNSNGVIYIRASRSKLVLIHQIIYRVLKRATLNSFTDKLIVASQDKISWY